MKNFIYNVEFVYKFVYNTDFAHRCESVCNANVTYKFSFMCNFCM